MLESTISTFRVKDARASETFYWDLLGFLTVWEYDPGEGYPVFLEIRRDQVSIHLTEHQGDGPEGVSIYVNVADADALHAEFVSRGAPVSGPPEDMPWDHKVFSVDDPDGNTLRFGSPA